MKKCSVSLVVLMGILFLNASATFLTPSVKQLENPIERLKTSAGEITIVTPENTTYTEPMSGYYPATYGFENEESGNTGNSIEFVDLDESTGSCTLTQIPSFNNHKKVLDLYDTSSSYSAGGKNIFDGGQDYGTVEFWWAISDVTRSSYVWLEDSSANDILVVRYSGLDFGRFDNGGWQAISGAPAPSNNQWYHIRIDWELTAGGYMGLAQNNFSIYIDGVQYGPYTVASTNTPDRIYLQTGVGASGNFHFYVDAIGYSWNPYYNIGDNTNEGLLLSYDDTTTSDWTGFSLDGQSNRTILGNTTIPMPANGLHKVQLFGNDSMGAMYESNLRYFTVDTSPYFNIITPENKTYTEPDGGHYSATYGFENDVDTSVPQSWVDNSQSGCTARVVSEKTGHKKVVYLDDDSGNKIYFDQYFPAQTHGTIELWVLAEDASHGFAIRTFDSGGSSDPYAGDHMVYVSFGSLDKWSYTNGAGVTTIIPTFDGVYDPVDNTWYHLTIHFRCNNSPSYMGLNENAYKIIVDGLESIELEASFGNIVNHVDRFDIATTAATTTDGWVDAIGYSWDSSYFIGDNLNEGLLLSYDTNIDFNWTAYSLDGQVNRTFLGNKTIPMPSDGSHNIIAFGNDSLGTNFDSNVRYFTTNAMGPDITINSPISNQLYGTTAPDFNLSIIDSDLDARWYSLDGGTTNVPFSGLTGTIDQTEWDKIGNGTVTIAFYANDTANNLGQAEVSVRKDIIAPAIIIVDPSNTEEFEFTPIYDITINEPSLDDFWYTIDGGAHNYTISETVGIINLAAWNVAPSGPVTIRFYARDLAGNVGTSFVIVVKTSAQEQPPSPPQITINSPTDSQIISSTAPNYDLSITGSYDSIWYTLDGGGTNYTATGLTGTIDQSAWSALSDGVITIDFYANNSAGMEGSAQVQVIKDSSEEPPTPPPGIPGYNVIALIGVCGIVTLIIVRKKRGRIKS